MKLIKSVVKNSYEIWFKQDWHDINEISCTSLEVWCAFNRDEIGIKVALKYEHFPEIHTSYNFQIAEITLNKDIKKI